MNSEHALSNTSFLREDGAVEIEYWQGGFRLVAFGMRDASRSLPQDVASAAAYPCRRCLGTPREPAATRGARVLAGLCPRRLGWTRGPAAPGVAGGRRDRWELSGRSPPQPKGR
jgi:hypothetical protein